MILAIYNPINVDKVVAGVDEEVDRLLRDGVTAEELDKAKTGYLQQQQVQRTNDPMLAVDPGREPLRRPDHAVPGRARAEDQGAHARGGQRRPPQVHRPQAVLGRHRGRFQEEVRAAVPCSAEGSIADGGNDRTSRPSKEPSRAGGVVRSIPGMRSKGSFRRNVSTSRVPDDPDERLGVPAPLASPLEIQPHPELRDSASEAFPPHERPAPIAIWTSLQGHLLIASAGSPRPELRQDGRPGRRPRRGRCARPDPQPRVEHGPPAGLGPGQPVALPPRGQRPPGRPGRGDPDGPPRPAPAGQSRRHRRPVRRHRAERHGAAGDLRRGPGASSTSAIRAGDPASSRTSSPMAPGWSCPRRPNTSSATRHAVGLEEGHDRSRPPPGPVRRADPSTSPRTPGSIRPRIVVRPIVGIGGCASRS